MRRTADMQTLSLLVVLAIALIMAAAAPVYAEEWVGSVTVMYEWPDTPNRVRIWALDYPWSNDLYFTLLIEENRLRGDAFDVSATYYVPFVKGVYATAGYRMGLDPGSERFPYVAITYRFAREVGP